MKIKHMILRMIVMDLVLFLMPLSFGTIINIPADYQTITEGITASFSGDTVLVWPGEYWEDVDPNGKNILLTSSNGPESTFIQGYINFSNGEDTTCVFRGFTVVGQGNDLFDVEPAVRCNGSGSPQIIGNIIKNNICMGSLGGGIGAVDANAIIKHNIIESNWAMGYGAGIKCSQLQKIEISYNIIKNNACGYGPYESGWGAGIHCHGATICYNLIYGNKVDCSGSPGQCGLGGGIFVTPSSPQSTSAYTYIHNNTIVSNIAQEHNEDGEGGGIFIGGSDWYDTTIIINNIIAYNINGGIIASSDNGIRKVINEYNLFYENTKYDLWKADTSETLIFDEDPLFSDTSAHNYQILEDSPCIDAGDPSYPLDPDSTRVDIGALFFDQSTSIDEKDINDRYAFELHQNYPNPFNAETRIEYILPQSSMVSLIIFDITGRIVKSIFNNEIQAAGNHFYIWNGMDQNNEEVSTAIYFYQLKINDQRRVKSMIMIK